MNEQALNRLKQFKSKDKFSNEEWDKRGLIPSDQVISNELNSMLNAAAEELIQLLNNGSDNSKLKKALKSRLKHINKSAFDTEEKEFIADYFYDLAEIVNVDFKDELNNWLYGSFLNTLMKAVKVFKGNGKILNVISQDCTKCKSKLETFVLEREEGIPDYSFFLVKCNECGEYNLLKIGIGIKRLKFGKYTMIEQLRKDEYTEAQANIRLEQIKYFRK
ncbi:MAG: DUF4844 domain-containing protein [Sporocytophaga sp.]|uniref:DUF4844 domain-containing protein n=1 Tax=Sporocytophaga sp. TaxID=2231183 RepID=UPI001B02F56F|nr:DUF4844 domain-containing protein [Sporocytophaga sp.]MBO9701869.1 DUF4844 domain-containing protein [Sporocytophaga sp.]